MKTDRLQVRVMLLVGVSVCLILSGVLARRALRTAHAGGTGAAIQDKPGVPLDAARAAALSKLLAQLNGGARFSAEETDILHRYGASGTISVLEADLLISRALYEFYIEGNDLSAQQEVLLRSYIELIGKREINIADRKARVLAIEGKQPPQSPLVAPPNDTCAGAEVIPGAGPFPVLTAVTADITDATTAGDPAIPSCTFGGGPVSRGIWYTFTPSVTATYTISSCADAPTGTTVDDTVLGIYTSPGGCAGPFTEIPTAGGSDGCDDDSCSSEALQSVVTTNLTSGTQYFIVISKFGTTAPTVGNTAVQLRVSQSVPAVPPPNDTCAGAEVIPGAGPFPVLTAVTADISAATVTGDPPVPSCQTSVSRSIWYTFTPSTSASYTISSCQNAPTGSTLPDTVMAIYTSAGGCAGPFTEIPTAGSSDGCDDDSCITLALQAFITTNLTSGTQYFIVIWKFGTTAPTPGSAAVQLRVTQVVCTSITCPANVTQTNDPNQCGAVVTYPAPTPNGSCGTINCSPASGSFFPVGTTTVTCTSSAGPTCQFTVTVTDNQPPSITCPANITKSNDPNQCGAVVTYPPPTITDNCSGSFTATCNPPSGSFFPVGTTTVTCTPSGGTSAAAGQGESGASYVVPPAKASSASGGKGEGIAGSSGGISAGGKPTTSNTAGGKSSEPSSPVSPLAVLYDQTNNAAPTPGGVTSQNFEAVNDAFDSEAADDFVVPAGQTWTIQQIFVVGEYSLAGPAASANVVFYADSSTLPGAVVATRNSSTISTDVAGDFTITLSSPAVLTSGTYWVSVQANMNFTPNGQWFWDNRSTMSNSGAAWRNPGGGFGVGCTSFGRKTTCITAQNGPDELFQILGTSAGTGGGSTCTFTVTVNDTQPPTITCPANQVRSNDPNQCGAVVTYPPPTVSDNCPGVGVPQCSPASGSFFPVGTTTVTCTVADSSGNTASCTFLIRVNDTQPPSITCPANITAVTNQNVCPSPVCQAVNFPPPTASDNCPGVTVVCNPPSGSCFPIGVTTVTCTATDASGNTATCSFTVTTFDVALQDDSDPSIIMLWNSLTGQYRFCCKGVTFTGVGKSRVQGCTFTLDHSTAPDRRVFGKVDKAAHAGNASLQFPAGTTRCTITDRNTLDDTLLPACQ